MAFGGYLMLKLVATSAFDLGSRDARCRVSDLHRPRDGRSRSVVDRLLGGLGTEAGGGSLDRMR